MNKFKIFTRYYLSKIPKLYFLFYHLNEKFFKKKKFIKFKLKKNMDFLIDGFPRSGNTYAYFAFLHMQKKKSIKLFTISTMSTEFCMQF